MLSWLGAAGYWGITTSAAKFERHDDVLHGYEPSSIPIETKDSHICLFLSTLSFGRLPHRLCDLSISGRSVISAAVDYIIISFLLPDIYAKELSGDQCFDSDPCPRSGKDRLRHRTIRARS